MRKNTKVINPSSKKHLTLSDRVVIESGLDAGKSVRTIASELNKSPSCISREIHKNIIKYMHRTNNCANTSCNKRYVCGETFCRRKCISCNRCTIICPEYIPKKCPYKENRVLKLCNGCPTFKSCKRDKERYEAYGADERYHQKLREYREGFDLTIQEIEDIDKLVSPLVKKGLSPYAIKQSLGNQISVSESTLRRLIDSCKLDARRIDLRDAVKRKRRKTHRNVMKSEIISELKKGRLYSDYLDYINENDTIAVQMDCVEGIKDDNKTLLTLHIPIYHFQLAFIMDYHTSDCVVEVLDLLEYSLGKELYSEVFGLILTDNGHEFTDINRMERSVFGGQRTKIFFCEPNRSDEKAECETNHKMIRYILPKGTSFEELTQSDICLMMSHINSYNRKSLFGKTPFELASSVIPNEFFDILGIEYIPTSSLNLTPSLLRKKD